jgi:hypothetical protein
LKPSSRKDFFQGKNFFSNQALRRAKEGTKGGGGGVFRTPCADFSRPVQELEYTCLLKSTFTEAVSHVRGLDEVYFFDESLSSLSRLG